MPYLSIEIAAWKFLTLGKFQEDSESLYTWTKLYLSTFSETIIKVRVSHYYHGLQSNEHKHTISTIFCSPLMTHTTTNLWTVMATFIS